MNATYLASSRVGSPIGSSTGGTNGGGNTEPSMTQRGKTTNTRTATGQRKLDQIVSSKTGVTASNRKERFPVGVTRKLHASGICDCCDGPPEE